MLKITKLPVGDLEANCYIVADDEMNAVIIDPGADGHIILDEIAAQGVKPLAMLLTHAHFDHFGAAADIMQEYPIPLYVHSLDRAMVTSAEYSLAVHLGYGAQYRMPQEDLIRTFEDNETLKFSEELEFLVIHTPGHSPGSSCFRHGDILFSGDTLFRQGVGRVDFSDVNNVEFTLDNKYVVRIGNSSSVEYKFGMLISVLSQLLEGDVGIINVSDGNTAHFSPT